MLISWIKDKTRKKNTEKKEQTGNAEKIIVRYELKESTKKLSNPGCGWYHMYSFDLSKENALYIACEEEVIVLLRIDIHGFRNGEITNEALEKADNIISFFAENKKEIILRIVYDTEGKGITNEPTSINIVKQHMFQLGKIIEKHKSEILVHQGIFVGSWGEMHSSRFLSKACMCELVKTLAEASSYTCPIALRKPSQYRQIEDDKINKGLLTLFNDGMLGSETDLGTYSENENVSGCEEALSREEELKWQCIKMQESFCGGEALCNISGKKNASWNEAADVFAKMHISYLNSTYQKELLEEWKKQKTTWNSEKMTGYEYIGSHLGYRFTVENVSMAVNKNLSKEDTYSKKLRITVKNTGFANLCEEAQCCLIIEDEAGITSLKSETNPNPSKWNSNTQTLLEWDISEWEEKKENLKIYLKLERSLDKQNIAFANEEENSEEKGLLIYSGAILL